MKRLSLAMLLGRWQETSRYYRAAILALSAARRLTIIEIQPSRHNKRDVE